MVISSFQAAGNELAYALQSVCRAAGKQIETRSAPDCRRDCPSEIQDSFGSGNFKGARRFFARNQLPFKAAWQLLYKT
jgi:hypothetical protein